MNKASKRYSDEFKKEVIDYSLQNNSSVKEICRNFGITSATYYSWKKKLLKGLAVMHASIGGDLSCNEFTLGVGFNLFVLRSGIAL